MVSSELINAMAATAETSWRKESDHRRCPDSDLPVFSLLVCCRISCSRVLLIRHQSADGLGGSAADSRKLSSKESMASARRVHSLAHRSQTARCPVIRGISAWSNSPTRYCAKSFLQMSQFIESRSTTTHKLLPDRVPAKKR
jgi:hypothetical protein